MTGDRLDPFCRTAGLGGGTIQRVGYGNIISLFSFCGSRLSVIFLVKLMLSCGQRLALSTGETRALSDEPEDATAMDAAL